MDDQREENSIALPRELWDEAASRAQAAGCGINDIIERALSAYLICWVNLAKRLTLILASCSKAKDHA